MAERPLVQRGLQGRPPRHAKVFLDRQRPILAARWVRSLRRALRYLNDESSPIDQTWVSLFKDVADRIGFERRTSQNVEATSMSASVAVEAKAEVVVTETVRPGDAIAFVERRLAALKAARESTEIGNEEASVDD